MYSDQFLSRIASVTEEDDFWTVKFIDGHSSTINSLTAETLIKERQDYLDRTPKDDMEQEDILDADAIPMEEVFDEETLTIYKTVLLKRVAQRPCATTEADWMFDLMARAWVAGQEGRPLLVEDFNGISNKGTREFQMNYEWIERNYSRILPSLTLALDPEVHEYARLHEKFKGVSPTLLVV